MKVYFWTIYYRGCTISNVMRVPEGESLTQMIGTLYPMALLVDYKDMTDWVLETAKIINKDNLDDLKAMWE